MMENLSTMELQPSTVLKVQINLFLNGGEEAQILELNFLTTFVCVWSSVLLTQNFGSPNGGFDICIKIS